MCRHLVHGGALHVDLRLPTLSRERKQRELFKMHLAQEMLDGVLVYQPNGVTAEDRFPNELPAACVVRDDWST
jgi:hypothetical protein